MYANGIRPGKAKMTLSVLADRIGAVFVAGEERSASKITRCFAGDTVSDLLNHVSEVTLLVTKLSNVTVVRAAALMDAPGICFPDGVEPGAEVVKAASEHGIAILLSPVGMHRTRERIRQYLSDMSGAP